MTKETIEAFDKDGAKLGEQVEDKPGTIEELREQFEDSDIVKLAWRSHVIDVQRELRAKVRAPSKENDNVKAFKKMTPEQQAALIAKLSEKVSA